MGKPNRKLRNCAQMLALVFGLTNICQTGCATSSGDYMPDPVVIEIRPPEELLTPCKGPEQIELETNEDLINLLIDSGECFNICAAKIDALIKFYGGNHGSR